MSVKCIGVRPYEFKPEDRTEKLTGYTIWFADEPDGSYGIIPFKVSLSQAKWAEILGRMSPQECVGCEFTLSYNRYGRVSGMDLVE